MRPPGHVAGGAASWTPAIPLGESTARGAAKEKDVHDGKGGEGRGRIAGWKPRPGYERVGVSARSATTLGGFDCAIDPFHPWMDNSVTIASRVLIIAMALPPYKGVVLQEISTWCGQVAAVSGQPFARLAMPILSALENWSLLK